MRAIVQVFRKRSDASEIEVLPQKVGTECPCGNGEFVRKAEELRTGNEVFFRLVVLEKGKYQKS